MKTSAPQLNALIIILRSTGPVISTQTLLQVWWRWGNLPLGAPDVGRLGEKVWDATGIELRLACGPTLKKLFTRRVERRVKVGDERKCSQCQDFAR